MLLFFNFGIHIISHSRARSSSDFSGFAGSMMGGAGITGGFGVWAGGGCMNLLSLSHNPSSSKFLSLIGMSINSCDLGQIVVSFLYD